MCLCVCVCVCECVRVCVCLCVCVCGQLLIFAYVVVFSSACSDQPLGRTVHSNIRACGGQVPMCVFA